MCVVLNANFGITHHCVCAQEDTIKLYLQVCGEAWMCSVVGMLMSCAFVRNVGRALLVSLATKLRDVEESSSPRRESSVEL